MPKTIAGLVEVKNKSPKTSNFPCGSVVPIPKFPPLSLITSFVEVPCKNLKSDTPPEPQVVSIYEETESAPINI